MTEKSNIFGVTELMTCSSQSQALGRLTTLGAFVFFAAMFVVPSGYSYGGGLLLLVSIWFLVHGTPISLSRDDRLMVAVLFAYFLVPSGMTLWLGNNFSDIDQYSRALLAIPILLLLLRVPIAQHAMWGSIVLGAVLSTTIAWWQVTILADTQAGGFMNKISFSNLTLVFVAFCAGGLFWARSQGRRAVVWQAAFIFGIIGGLYSTIVGGSRGSWVAALPLAMVFVVTFWSPRSARALVLWLSLTVTVLVGLFVWPNSPLRTRYDAGVENITQIERGNTANSIGARLEIYKGAWNNLKRQPILGWNMQEYASVLRDQVKGKQLDPIALRYTDNLHNNFFQAWVFTGLPGLLALLAMYGVPLWHFGRRLRDPNITVRVLAFCGSSVVVSFICFSLTYSALRRNYGIMFYVVSLVIFWGGLHHARQASLSCADK